MGSKVTPNFANVLMGDFKEKFVYDTEWVRFFIEWIRFIDDICLIWKADKDLLMQFVNHLNHAMATINIATQR